MEVDPRIVLPGDVIEVNSESTIVLGPGLRQEGDDVVATKAGILYHLEVGNRYWVESNQKRVKPNIENEHY
jgi:exosome complex component RRP40